MAVSSERSHCGDRRPIAKRKATLQHILVLDDEERVTQVLALSLAQFDYRTSVATTPRDGLRILREEQVDLLIVDIFMPKVSGLDMIRRLKREMPKVKILAISGGGLIAGRDCLELAVEAGADGSLRKPLTAKALTETVRELLPDAA
jgi:DNA-binding response OmpR family regulator